MAPGRAETFARAVGESLRYYRHRAGLTAEDIASVLGLSRSTWYEREATGEGLTVSELSRASSACGVRTLTVLRRALLGPSLTRGGY